MSGREPMWFCHECESEMRPLMVPDPHCSRCNGTFVEKLENPDDDPRMFHQHDAFHGLDDHHHFSPVDFLMGLQSVMSDTRPASPRHRDRPRSPPFTTSSSSFSIRSDRTNGGTTRSFTTHSRDIPPHLAEGVPPIFPFGAPTRDRREGGDITGPLMFQYLATILSQSGRNGAMHPMFAELFGADSGRMGDYVFSQEALDQILTQLMEHSSTRPVPATEQIVKDLPKVVLEEGSPLLEKDCAVCKEQFQLGTEDPNEQIIITLPCKHPFHEPCITPWLKSSGTCPVCRHELVPQPQQHGPGEGPSRRPTQNRSNSGGSNTNSSSNPFGRPGSPRSSRSGHGLGGGDSSGSSGGLFGNLFSSFMPGQQNNSSSTPGGSSQRRGSSNNNNNRRSSRDHVPGGWEDVD